MIVGFSSRWENISGLSSTGFSIITQTGSWDLSSDSEDLQTHNPLLRDGTLGFHWGVVDHLSGQDSGGKGDPLSDDISLGLLGGLVQQPTPPVRLLPSPPPAPPPAWSASSSPSSSGSYNSKCIGLSGGAFGTLPKSDLIGRTDLFRLFSIAFLFFPEDSSFREDSTFMNFPSFTVCASPSSSLTSVIGLADFFAFLIAISKNCSSFFSCFLMSMALGLHFTSLRRAVISAFMAVLEFWSTLILASFVTANSFITAKKPQLRHGVSVTFWPEPAHRDVCGHAEGPRSATSILERLPW